MRETLNRNGRRRFEYGGSIASVPLPNVDQCVRIKKDGERCRGSAVTGTTLCRMHGGTRKAVRAAGAARRAAGIDPFAPKVSDIPIATFIDAETAALASLAQLLRLTTFVGNIVQEYDAEAFVVNDSEVGRRVAPMVELLRGLLGDASRWTQSAMKLRLEDRRIRLEEERVRWIVDVLVAAIDGAPISADARALIVERVGAGLAAGRAPSPELVGTGACGTEGGRMKHRERGEELCDACRAAYNDAQAARARSAAAKRRTIGTPDAEPPAPVVGAGGVDLDDEL